jgi:hypothetical protein
MKIVVLNRDPIKLNKYEYLLSGIVPPPLRHPRWRYLRTNVNPEMLIPPSLGLIIDNHLI